MRGTLFCLFAVGTAMVAAGSFGTLAAQENAPDTVVMTGASPLGGVKFSHAAHQERAECTACHHESRPEMPLTSEHQPCSACHTNPPTAPMTTSIRDAFHDARAQSGTCVNCHRTESEAGTVVPLKCAECHKRDIT
jgi:hypothetical protein